MQQHIIDAVVANAAKHEHQHGTPPERWDYQRDLRYLRSLMEEVGELAASLKGTHEHPMELELVQIVGICLNWRGARGTTPEQLALVAQLDARKHPDRKCPGCGYLMVGPSGICGVCAYEREGQRTR